MHIYTPWLAIPPCCRKKRSWAACCRWSRNSRALSARLSGGPTSTIPPPQYDVYACLGTKAAIQYLLFEVCCRLSKFERLREYGRPTSKRPSSFSGQLPLVPVLRRNKRPRQRRDIFASPRRRNHRRRPRLRRRRMEDADGKLTWKNSFKEGNSNASSTYDVCASDGTECDVPEPNKNTQQDRCLRHNLCTPNDLRAPKPLRRLGRILLFR